MDRREFINRCLAGITLGLGGISSFTFSNQALSATTARKRFVPTRIDTHGHTVTGLTPDRVIELMDMVGISHMVLMARGRRNDKLTTEIYRNYPQRILPFVSSMYPGWHRQDLRVLGRAQRLLRTGIFRGVGEVMLRYYGIPSKNEPEINVPADSDFIKKLSDIVVRHNGVMIVHMEPEPDAIESLENLLEYNKELKLIWAHCGTVARIQAYTIGHADIGAIMDRHPNLYTDIAGVQPMSLAPSGGLRRPQITNDDGVLYDEFKDILEKHSDRVLFGLDTPWMQCWDEGPFREWVVWADKVVAQLETAGAAERIMYQNAARLFNI